MAVGIDAPAMLGQYTVADGALRFTPLFPFDEGRQYQVRFEAARLPGVAATRARLEATVGRPASTCSPLRPSSRGSIRAATTVPENLLRMYIEFSAPMGRKSGVEYISLLDHAGREIPGAVLPLDYEFWSPDHTRFTVFFDPGRVKKGILPNLQMGRPLEVGRSVTLVISREWRDEHGLPLKEEFRRDSSRRSGRLNSRSTPPSWRIQAPAAGGRDAVVVTFPEPLDHGLLMRALGVTRDGQCRGWRDRGRPGRDAMDVHAGRCRGVRARTSCSRSTSSRTWPATRSAAHSRSTTSTRWTRARTRRRSPSPSGSNNAPAMLR